MIGRVNGHAMSSANGINNGTERAVSNEERLNMLLQQARQVQTDISPANWTPTKLACEEIDKLTVELRQRDDTIGNLRVAVRFANEKNKVLREDLEYFIDCTVLLEDEIDRLKRPLWVKIVGWFAR